MFSSSMVLQWIMKFSSYQQNDQKCMKPHFQWLACCTHVWPSIEDVNFSFFCADKRQVYPRWSCILRWSNNFREEHKTRVKTTFSISIQIKCLCGREHEKGVMFISSMVLQWIMKFSSYQQNDQKCMKPQFQWLACCTHVWPSIEDVNFSFFCADKRQVYPRWNCNLRWSNNFREEHKTI